MVFLYEIHFLSHSTPERMEMQDALAICGDANMRKKCDFMRRTYSQNWRLGWRRAMPYAGVCRPVWGFNTKYVISRSCDLSIDRVIEGGYACAL